MKTLLVFLVASFFCYQSSANGPVKIDEQILRSFAVNFPNAQRVVWQELDEAYVVSFLEDDIRIRITYMRSEASTHVLRYYNEKNLPLDIRLKIKNRLPHQKIHGVTEETRISSSDNRSRTMYYIKLNDDSHWYTVKAQRHKRLKLIEKLDKN